MVAEEKDPSKASEEAKAAEKILAEFIEKLSAIAAECKKIERGGQIVKDKRTGKYSLNEHTGENDSENHGRRWGWPASKKEEDRIEKGASPPIVGPDGKVDVSKPIRYDTTKTIEIGWHVHPYDVQDVIPEPSTKDGDEAKSNKLVEIVLYHDACSKETRIYIVDTDGKYYRYRPR